MTQNDLQVKKNRAVLVGLWAHRLSVEENATEETMEELADLLETAGGECVGTVLQSKDSPDPRTFIGEGKVAEVRELVRAMDADMVIFDNSLSPSQQRVLSEELKVAVMDRSALILDIFAQRARTREGRLQVELAQYKYLLPRLLGMWTHLERQEGAIGTRGPGETQLETDRRHIHRKIAKLEDELRDVRRVRATQRERRIKNEVPVVAIVGYTNAGKSTLLNKLTGAEIPANNRLFDTLDTTTRTLEISDTCTVLLSDTVGLSSTRPTPSGGSRRRWWISSSTSWGPTRPPGWRCSTSATCGRERSVPMGRTSSPSPPAPARGSPPCWRPLGSGWTAG